MLRSRHLAVVIAAAVVVAACSGDAANTTSAPAEPTTAEATVEPTTEPTSEGAQPTAEPTTDVTTEPTVEATTEPTVEATTEPTEPLAAATWTMQPGWEQVAILDATPSEQLELVDDEDAVVADGTVDAQGALLFRQVDAGTYTVRSAIAESQPFDVAPIDQLPPPELYSSQQLPAPGFGYLENR